MDKQDHINSENVLAEVAKRIPSNYQLQRVVSVGLDLLLEELMNDEQHITNKYGEEILDLIHNLSQGKEHNG